MTFDDQDWVLESLADHERRDSSTAWKMAAMLAIGILLGALSIIVLLAYRTPAAVATAPAALPASEPVARLLPSPPVGGTANAAIQDDPRRATQSSSAERARDERKERAWAKLYKKPPQCDDPSAGEPFVECANHFIRARREFEQAYAAGKL